MNSKNKTKLNYEKPTLITLAKQGIYGYCLDGSFGDNSGFFCRAGVFDSTGCGYGNVALMCNSGGSGNPV